MTKDVSAGLQSTLATFKALRTSWSRKGNAYQKWDGRVRSVVKALHYFEGDVVLDIGCNSGLLTVMAALYAHKAIGIEMRRHSYKKAVELSHALKFSNLTFGCKRLSDFVDDERFQSYGINAVLATRVLYHLSDKDMTALRERVLPTCKHIIAVSREDKGKSNNKYNLHKATNITNMLRTDGFTVTSLNRHGPDIILLGQR